METAGQLTRQTCKPCPPWTEHYRMQYAERNKCTVKGFPSANELRFVGTVPCTTGFERKCNGSLRLPRLWYGGPFGSFSVHVRHWLAHMVYFHPLWHKNFGSRQLGSCQISGLVHYGFPPGDMGMARLRLWLYNAVLFCRDFGRDPYTAGVLVPSNRR